MTPKFTIKSYKFVCSSIYKCKNTECAICKNNLSENSVAEENLISSNVNIGVCGHGFHKKCIFKAYESKQLSKKCSVFRCPCCRTSLGTDIEEINERYDLYNEEANGLDILESFWIKKDYTMPLICNEHYLGMGKNCTKCENYKNVEL